ncbi:pseudouridylate synthase [Rhodocytophaga rosea]|uniref:tRNA pseudouridine synthase C n=1 Tax=Rhodocytophaga rosea TaxID=2704465 RepID=A0A6C0GNI2_9BACT|nr:pseudouridine synthase [Rhodocytophaga rosea]QHT69404.1 pseudouridylate synthase [Rhodocytophaga rosea]
MFQTQTLLPILYQDEHLVAINKPNGLLVHRTRIAEENKAFALQLLRNQLGQRVYPLHRLDRPTSGVLLFGLSKESAQKLMPLFEEREVAKTYLAVVRGYVKESESIEYALKEETYKEPQYALTEYKRLATVEIPVPVGRYQTARYSLVEATPLTGRMHQIRKHFAHISHYIIGDKKHGDWRHNQMFAEKLHTPFLLLHAYAVRFTHPFTGERICIEAPLPAHFRSICLQFGWQQVLEEVKISY